MTDSTASQTHEMQIAYDTLERYSGSAVSDFCGYLMLTNFGKYVDYFANSRDVPIHEGSMFRVAHCPSDDVSIIDFKLGSPAASLVVDICSFLPIRGSVMLGMCGGLRRSYRVGDYLIPVAAIRGEGTSDFYFPHEVPALANFMVQRAITHVLEKENISHHIGIAHTTNKRFWEFDKDFRERIQRNRAQAIEMECATLFIASYKHKLPLGALLLVSDLPLNKDGIKTKESSKKVFAQYTSDHVELGVKSMKYLNKLQDEKHWKGMHRDDIHRQHLV